MKRIAHRTLKPAPIHPVIGLRVADQRLDRLAPQVEIWFGIFQRKTLNNASFRSIEQLVQAIHAFTVA